MFDENGNECATSTAAGGGSQGGQGNQFAMLNHLMNVKDSRWLQLEVCREFQRGQCSRTDLDCKFAHPLPHVEVQNGKVTACYDSIKGRCTRDNPKCKYLHPPQHLKDQLLINGRNNLALKNMLVQQIANPTLASAANTNLLAAQQAALVQQQYGMVQAPTQYPYGVPTSYGQTMYNPMMAMPMQSNDLQSQITALQQAQQQQQPVMSTQSPQTTKTDRVEVCRQFVRGLCQRVATECKFAHPPTDTPRHADGTVSVCVCNMAMPSCPMYHPPKHILAQMKATPGTIMTSQNAQPQTQYAQVADVNGNAAQMMSLQQRIHAHVAQQPGAGDDQQQQQQSPSSSTSIVGKKRAHDADATQLQAAQHAAALAYQQQQQQLGYQATMASYQQQPHDQQDMMAPLMAALQQQQQAAAALLQAQQQQQMVAAKRPAMDNKAGMPVYQPQMAYAPPFTPLMPQMGMPPMQFNPYMTQSSTTGGDLMLLQQQQQQQLLEQVALAHQQQQLTRYATNIASVAYFDESGKLLDNLPVCRDFKQGHCDRSACRYVHLLEDYVDISDGKVVVCRDAAKGKCVRHQCKYYHIPTLTAQPPHDTAV